MSCDPLAVPRVIVHADDFGIHPSVNEGIAQAHTRGIVTSTSIMVPGEAFEDAIQMSRRMPGLDLGLHFCLVGVPGFPATLGQFTRALVTRRLSSTMIADALRRQLDVAVGKHRLAISHIDSHQHLHALPGVMRIVCQIAPLYGIRAVRLPREGRAGANVTGFRRAQAAALNAAARRSAEIVAGSEMHTTRQFRGMAVSGSLTAACLCRYLAHAGAGVTEIVCHPGANNKALRGAFAWGYDWEGELGAVCDPAGHRLIHAGRAKLVTWRDIVDSEDPVSRASDPCPRSQ